jgi:protein-S-isoprenylcysteine O-methyltransferase Ste14
LFLFLHGDFSSSGLAPAAGRAGNGLLRLPVLLVDAALALQFAVPHSLLLWPPVQKRLKRWIAGEFYGSVYCVVTCLTLLVMFICWQTSSVTLWRAQGLAAVAIRLGFYASWCALFYSLHLTGLGYQTGWTQWRHWFLRTKPPRRTFQPRGAYRWFRHPVYVSFLGLIWFTPTMTLDHAVLTGLWTVYILYGSHLKDERLAFYLGDEYLQYRAAVPAYPLLRLVAHRKRPVPGSAGVEMPAPPR